MSLTDITAAPKLMQISGSTYKVGPLSLYQTGILQRYINDAAKSPYQLAKAEADRLDVPESERAEWLRIPRESSRGWKPPEIGITPGWPAFLLGDYAGILCFLYVTFQAHNPGFNMEDAEKLASSIGQAQLAAIFNVAMDIDEQAEPEEDGAPKA